MGSVFIWREDENGRIFYWTQQGLSRIYFLVTVSLRGLQGHPQLLKAAHSSFHHGLLQNGHALQVCWVSHFREVPALFSGFSPESVWPSQNNLLFDEFKNQLISNKLQVLLKLQERRICPVWTPGAKIMGSHSGQSSIQKSSKAIISIILNAFIFHNKKLSN